MTPIAVAMLAAILSQQSTTTHTDRAASITVDDATQRIIGIVVAENPACSVEYHYRETWLGDKILIWITCAGEAPCPSYTCAVEEDPVPVHGHTIIWCECVQ
jgi:hypothetical protein